MPAFLCVIQLELVSAFGGCGGGGFGPSLASQRLGCPDLRLVGLGPLSVPGLFSRMDETALQPVGFHEANRMPGSSTWQPRCSEDKRGDALKTNEVML